MELSGRVCPGARRHPYAAWRKLGGLGADYLTAVAKELCGPNAGQMLLEAFPLDTEGIPELNVGLMVLIPKKAPQVFRRAANSTHQVTPGRMR